MLLCSHCIEELKSRGEVVYVNYDIAYTVEESEEMDITCEWCNEYDDLYECKVDQPW